MSRATMLSEIEPSTPQGGPDSVRHYVYASRSASGAWSDEALLALVNAASLHNDRQNIRGLLIVFRDYFVQWLEGPEAQVDALATRISTDERHADFVELLSISSRALLPRPWLTVRISRDESQQLTDDRFALLKAIGQRDYAGALSAASIIRAFTLPADLPGKLLLDHHAKKIRVVLSADDLLWPVAVVHSMARWFNKKTKRTHFSQLPSVGPDSIGTVEYLDVPQDETHHFAYRFTACASPTVDSAYAESVFADADLLVFLVRASRVELERERLRSLLALPCFTQSRPHLVLLFSQAAESNKDYFLEGFDVRKDAIAVHTLSLADSDSILDIVRERLAAIQPIVAAQQRQRLEGRTSSATRQGKPLTSGKNPIEARSPELYLVPTPPKARVTSEDPPASHSIQLQGKNMSNVPQQLQAILKIDGATACALVDYTSGMTLGVAGGGGINMDVAAAGNTEVIRAKMKVAKALGLDAAIEDILITLTNQYHVIRPIASKQGLFFYVVIDRAKGNLAMARFQIAEAEKGLQI